MRLLVTGGRDFKNTLIAYFCLERIHGDHVITCLGHGDAPGADRICAEWAKHSFIPVEAFPANWSSYFGFAGPRRNQQMLDEFKPDALLALPGHQGTFDMKVRARERGVRVISYKDLMPS